MPRQVRPQTMIIVLRTSEAPGAGKLPLSIGRERPASTSSGGVADGKIADSITDAPRAESGVMDRKIVSSWKRPTLDLEKEPADDLEPAYVMCPHLQTCRLTRGVGQTGQNKVV